MLFFYQAKNKKGSSFELPFVMRFVVPFTCLRHL